MKTYETKRMVLRPGTREDYDKYIAHVVEADEIFVQYGYEPTEEILEAIREPYAGTMLFSMISKTAGDMLGYIGITEELDNLEFYTFPDYRNQGYCTEAVKVLLQAYLCGDLTGTPHDQVYGETIDVNEASMRVLEKCGFEKEALGMSVSINDNGGYFGQHYYHRYVYKKRYMIFGNIEWIILAREGDKALLLSKDCIEERTFHEELKPVTWKTCSLRSYLNGPWYEKTFREEEKAKIQTTKVKNADSRDCGIPCENDTEDKVFLLSVDEVEQYFYYDHDRIAEFNGESHEWWLRSPGNAGCVTIVRRDGRIYSVGWEVDSACGGIRPAIWIKLES